MHIYTYIDIQIEGQVRALGNICPAEVRLASVNLEKRKDPRWRQLANEPAENTDTGMGTSR